MRNLRLDDETWRLVGEEAARRGVTRSDVMRDAIEDAVVFGGQRPEPTR
jgi:predicted transcriptional regulator